MLKSGITLLCPSEKHLSLISHYWGQAVYMSWWPSLTKDLQTEPQKGVLQCSPHDFDRCDIAQIDGFDKILTKQF